jgi:hypothetical protein
LGLDNVLSRSDQKYSITTHLDPSSNIAIINSDAGYSNFSAFMSQVMPPTKPVALLAPHMIPDDDEEVTESPRNNIKQGKPMAGQLPSAPMHSVPLRKSIQSPLVSPKTGNCSKQLLLGKLSWSINLNLLSLALSDR